MKKLSKFTWLILILVLTVTTSCNSDDTTSTATEDADIPDENSNGIDLPIPDFDFNRPAGIYLLGVSNTVSEIRDHPFVDGYVLRTGWRNIEIAENDYDFSKIDQFIQELDAINQKLSLIMFSQRIPQYLIDDPDVELYESFNQNNNGSSFFTAVPWDEKALERYQLFYKALGDHLVMSIDAGAEVPLRDHPVLSVIGVQVMGLGGVRDPGGVIASIPSYNRELFTAASITSLQTPITEFPDKFVHVAFFGISDDNSSPELDDHLVDVFNTNFNSGEQPKLGFFAENLACETPGINSNDVLYTQKESTYTMFQMLQAWQDPFQNASNTDICNSDTNGPDIGMEYGFTNFNTRYFEVYPIDLDHEGYWPVLQNWHDFLEDTLSQ